MDLPATPPSPPGAAAMPPGQPPTGSSPATQPVANQGQKAAGLAVMSVAVKLLEKSFGMIGVGDEAGKDILDALKRLSKHVPAGQTPPGVENNAMTGAMDENRRNAMLMAQRGAGGGGMPPGAGAPPPPMQAAA